jgi:hypothetical protein
LQALRARTLEPSRVDWEIAEPEGEATNSRPFGRTRRFFNARQVGRGMARTLSTTRYPLLKFLAPLAILIFAVGLFFFFTQTTSEEQGLDPKPLLWFALAAAAVLFASLLWKRKEQVTVLLPSDRLQEATRQDLQGILETLERQREKGELTPERYTKARNKVLAEMKAAK